MTAQSPNPAQARWLDVRAQRIADPVERLRFLRRETRPAPARGRRKSPRRFLHRPLLWVGIAVAVTISTRRTAVRANAPAAIVVPKTEVAISAVRTQIVPPAAPQDAPPAAPPDDVQIVSAALPKVWMVDRSATLESYSNGLRIDLASTAGNRPRESYPIFALSGGTTPARYGEKPAGIVFHTTESHLAPFEEAQTGRLKRLGSNLLDVLRHQHSYHYVIDRFGRVFRIVPESDVANHSGNSVWADGTGIYVNLNTSFLGVAFEAQTGAAEAVTPAQILAGRLLTEMLRSRYAIVPENCVTHAQVSVSPHNMHIGAHVDWAAQFPFALLGLPDNYQVPLPSLYAFGFESDVSFVRSTGGGWRGLKLAAAQVAQQADAEGISTARYRAKLQRRYRGIRDVVREEEEQEPAEQSDGRN